MHDDSKQARFEQHVVPHLDAAYNLARWLTRDTHNAEDVVQDAYLRAYRAFDTFRGGDCRAWLLTIVRNTCYSWLRHNRAHELTIRFDEELQTSVGETLNPETLVLERLDAQILTCALEALPLAAREVMILRELEGLSYKEIASIVDIPIGTVMSRLARARKRLQQELSALQGGAG